MGRAISGRSLTAIVGASGSGKSSVILAGLAPRLEALGGWRFSYFRVGTEPDKNPFAALARALEPLVGERGVVDRLNEVSKLAAALADGSISLTHVLAAARRVDPNKRILLIADQFEEVFVLVPDEALRDRFIDTLIAAFRDPTRGSPPDFSLILTLRGDYYGAALRHRSLADALQDSVENLGPLRKNELRDAVEKPAYALHVGFEPGLVENILDDVGRRPGSLPLLQFALREMWGRLEKPLMTRAGYDSIGGVDGALAIRAQGIFDAATRQGGDTTAVTRFRRLFTRLVLPGREGDDVRRVVSRAELDPDTWALAQELAGEDNRLVVTAAAAGQETVEIVHDALIYNWPTLVDWIKGHVRQCGVIFGCS